MKTKKVTVVPYDPQWKLNFEAISKELKDELGDLALSIEHVGSTSVPGLAAKPIIDVDVVIEDYCVFPEVIAALKRAGYCHEGNLGIPEREAFRYDRKMNLQEHHLYVCPKESRELHRHLVFRDYLCANPDAANAYGLVKEEAAGMFPDSIEQYMIFKEKKIKEIYIACGLE